MSKTAELIRLITVLILTMVIVGIMGYFIPRIDSFLTGNPLVWGLNTHSDYTEDSFGEQAVLQKKYADSLQKDIVQLIEKTTGNGTVYATVQADLNLTRETIQQKDRFPMDDSFQGSALALAGQANFETQKLAESDFSETKSWIQSTAGIVQHLSVSVLIDGQMVPDQDGRKLYQPRTRSEMENYKSLIKAIVGFDSDRGDTLEVLNLPFSEDNRTFAGVAYQRWISGGLFLIFAGIVLVFFLTSVFPMVRYLIRDTAVLHKSHLMIDPRKSVISGEKMPPKQNETQQSHIDKMIALCRKSPDRVVRVLKNWIHQGTSARRGYIPIQKAAIVCLALGEEMMRDLFQKLDDVEIQRLGRTMGALGTVKSSDVLAVLNQFCQVVISIDGVIGSNEDVKHVFNRTMPKEKGEQLYSEIRLTSGGQTIWSRLDGLDLGALVPFVCDQKPETAALILYHLSDAMSSRVMGLLPKEFATRVMIHLAHLKHIRTDVREKLEREISVRVCDLIQQAQSRTGSEKISAILRGMDIHDKASLMAAVSQKDPEIFNHVASWLIHFEDLISWPDPQIQLLMKYVDRHVMAIALQGASEEVRSVFVRNIPPSAWLSLNNEMKKLTASDLERVSEARSLIVKTARELILLKKITVKK